MSLAVLTAAALTSAQTAPISVHDVFDREITSRGVTLTDWEGHIANPAIRLSLKARPELQLPARIDLAASNARIAFDLPSRLTEAGPSKVVSLTKASPAADIWITIFPDYNGQDEAHSLTIRIEDANEHEFRLDVPIHVLDQDQTRNLDYKIVCDFSYDQSGFFENSTAKQLTQRAADDWAYFLADQKFDPVAPGSEKAWIWDLENAFTSGREIVVAQGVEGTLLFIHGIRGREKRSGGIASDRGGIHTRAGEPTGLRRSGTISIEVTGNWNELGWQFLQPDEHYERTGNQRAMQHDYYSIVRHEIGHAIAFHRVHPALSRLERNRQIVSRVLSDYLGRNPAVAEVEHFYDTIDPVSRVGVFGNEYGGDFPRKRWIITKFDLLALKAMGWLLRETTPFQTLRLLAPASLKMSVGKPSGLALTASGGVPTYRFSVASGSLPPGIALDSFTGEFAGTPSAKGVYRVTVEVRDQDPTAKPVRKTLAIEVGKT